MRTSPTRLCIIGPLSQHDEGQDGQLAGDGHSGRHRTFAERRAAIGLLQPRVEASGGPGGFHQQEPHQTIAVLGQVPKALPRGTGNFCRNQAQVAGQVALVGETVHSTEHQCPGLGCLRTHAGVVHQASPGLPLFPPIGLSAKSAKRNGTVAKLLLAPCNSKKTGSALERKQIPRIRVTT